MKRIFPFLFLFILLLPQQASAKNGYAPPAGWPQGIEIPKINVHAHIQPDSLYGAPKPIDQEPRWGNVLWRSSGPKPGEHGRAFMAGHLDTFCCPDVFWNLRLLSPGDIIRIYYKRSFPLTFRVIWTHMYWDQQMVPVYRWMYSSKRNDARSLALMTCTGVWNGPASGYDRRLVVFARLVLPNGKYG